MFRSHAKNQAVTHSLPALSPALAGSPWLVHAFSTRLGKTNSLDGGVVFNLGFTNWDSRENIVSGRTAFLSALGAAGFELCTLRQIHSDAVHLHVAAPRTAPRGDAMITSTPGLLLGVQTADCVPILLVDPLRRAVAAIHAGWRGTLKRIAAKTLGRMRMAFGTRPDDVIAVLGPSIGRCCYDVGPEVAQAFAGQFANAREWFDGPYDRLASGEEPNPLKWLTMTPPGHNPPPLRVQLDLVAANRWQLVDAGVEPEKISDSGLCTSCRGERFFSYRREGARTGRMMAVIGIRGK